MKGAKIVCGQSRKLETGKQLHLYYNRKCDKVFTEPEKRPEPKTGSFSYIIYCGVIDRYVSMSTISYIVGKVLRDWKRKAETDKNKNQKNSKKGIDKQK